MQYIRIHHFHSFSTHSWYHWLVLFVLLVLLLFAFPRRAGSAEWEVFTTENSPLVNNRIEAIAFDWAGRAWIGTIGGLMRYDDGTWTTYTTGNSGLPYDWVTDIAFDSAHQVWVATAQGVGVLSGSNWTVYTKENTDNHLKNNHTTSVVIDGSGWKWFGTEGSAICLHNGSFWDWYHYDRTPELTGYWIHDLHLTPGWTVWIATKSGATSYYDGTWKHYGIPIPGQDPDAVEIWYITNDKYGDICAVTSYGIWKYGDFGWYDYPIEIEDESLTGMTVALFDNHHSAAGSIFGVAMEIDESWVLYDTDNSPLPDNTVRALATGPDDRLWIGTSEGLAIYTAGSTGVETKTSPGPSPLALTGPAYPNPFNASTVIPFTVTGSTSVTVGIYSITGQHIRTLASGMYEPGRYTVAWDGADNSGIPAATGVYLYRIVSPVTTVSGSMMLVK